MGQKINLKTNVKISAVDVATPDGAPLSLGVAYRVALSAWAPEGKGAATLAMQAVELSQKLAKDEGPYEMGDSDLLLIRSCLDENPAKWPIHLLNAVYRHAMNLDVSAHVAPTAPAPDGAAS